MAVGGFELITAQRQLHEKLAHFAGGASIALDTEASSFHRYRESVCLIQLSDRAKTLLVDPLSIKDLSPLRQLLAEKKMEVVIHDADYDLRILARHHQIRVENVFDTLVAAELVNEPEIGLAPLLSRYFGITVDKKFQKADWSQRPLPEAMLSYAAGDTSHLIELRDMLAAKLKEKGRWEWAQEEFELLTDAPFNLVESDEPAYLRMKGAKTLKPQQLAILRELHPWREAIAEQQDRAPFMILGNDVMLSLSIDPPKDLAELARRKGISERLFDRYGRDIMPLIEKARSLPKDQWPKVERPKRWSRDPDHDERLKRLKQVRDKLTRENDLRPGIVAANQMLSEIARTMPGDIEALAALPGIRRYQVRNFGEALLKAI